MSDCEEFKDMNDCEINIVIEYRSGLGSIK